MMGGAVSAFSGIREQIREEVRARFDDMALRLDLVPREEFEKLEAMLTKLREEQETLKTRIAKLEGQKKKAPKKATSKKTKSKK